MKQKLILSNKNKWEIKNWQKLLKWLKINEGLKVIKNTMY